MIFAFKILSRLLEAKVYKETLAKRNELRMTKRLIDPIKRSCEETNSVASTCRAMNHARSASEHYGTRG